MVDSKTNAQAALRSCDSDCAQGAIRFMDPLSGPRWGLDAAQSDAEGSREDRVEQQLERIRQWALHWKVDPVVIPLIFDMGLGAYQAAIDYAPSALRQPWFASGFLPSAEPSKG